MKVQIQHLNSSHDRKRFDCGTGSLNDWLQTKAKQHQEKKLSQTYVATSPDDPTRIIGYYALAATRALTAGMQGKKLPTEVSAVLLARLAVDKNNQGQGLGEFLLTQALDVAVSASNLIGAQCVVVDAIDDTAAAFYVKYGFTPLTTEPMTLYLPIASIP
ncbi:GNAT family N-acetyltransferase (plasmid) [Cupriavidus metallidurans]|uniref:GNAT family N-acetyltransferase n=1 Tax=Cupriavidus metallidurans TaxID=119219 RepID=UPI003D73667D